MISAIVQSAATPSPAANATNAPSWTFDHGVLNSIPAKLAIVLLVAIIATIVVNRGVRIVVQQAVRRAEARNETPLSGMPDSTTTVRAVISKQRVAQRSRAVGQMLRSTSAFVIWGTAVISMLQIVGINIAPLLFSASVIGVALGFGAQTLIKDFLSGIFIVIEDQYGPGDYVDLGLARGRVEEVGLRVTTLRDSNGVAWYVRNGEISRVSNRTQGWAPADIDITVPNTVQLPHLQAVLTTVSNVALDDDQLATRLLSKPMYGGVVFKDDDTVTVRLIAKTKPTNKAVVREDLMGLLRTRLRAAQIPVVAMVVAADEPLTPGSDTPKPPENPRLGLRPSV